MAKEAGYVTFQGLPGKVKTGCALTPELRSRYCALHKPRVCAKPLDDENTTCDGEDIAEMIVEERVTRSGTHYKVCMSWVINNIIIAINFRYCG